MHPILGNSKIKKIIKPNANFTPRNSFSSKYEEQQPTLKLNFSGGHFYDIFKENVTFYLFSEYSKKHMYFSSILKLLKFTKAHICAAKYLLKIYLS